MKASHLVTKNSNTPQQHPLYEHALKFGQAFRMLTEGKMLNTGEISSLFTSAEKAMTDGGNNRTLIGKAGEMAGALGAKIKTLAQDLQDSSPVQGIDKMYDDLKTQASSSLSKSPQGAGVLRAIDSYRQIVQRHPNTSKFFFGVAGVLTGLLTSGVAPLVILGAMKTIDGMLQGKQLSTSVGGAAAPVGAALGAKALAGAGDALAQGVDSAGNAISQGIDAAGKVDLNPFDNVDPQVNPADSTQVVPPAVETQTITVKSGESMSEISVKYKVNPDELAQLNPDKFGPQGNPNVLKPGDEIILPKTIDAAAYKGAYAGDNAMTAQNIQNKVDTGQYGTDQGMAAKRLAADAAAAAKAKTAATPAASAATSAPSAQTAPFNASLVRTESIEIRPAKGILEGFDIITAPVGLLIDREHTVRRWALNESLGRHSSRSVQLTPAGVYTIFYNLERLYEAVTDRPESQTPEAEAKRQARAQVRAGNPVATDGRPPSTINTTIPGRTAADLQRDQQGGTVRSRPANANDATAMAKNANADNTSTTAGPLGGLPGGNVAGLATGTAPAGNTMPYLTADPEGKFDTKYKGGISSGISRGVETGLGRLGRSIKDIYKDATTKVTASGLMRTWKDQGSNPDSDQVAQVLMRKKVPAEIIQQLYSDLKFPAPKLQQDNTTGSTTAQQDGTDSDMYQKATAGLPALPPGQQYMLRNGQLAMRFDPEQNRDVPATIDVGKTDASLPTTTPTVTPNTTTTTTGNTDSATTGDGKITQATGTILPMLARMTGPAYADDLLSVIDLAFSVLQRSAPTVYREKMMQFKSSNTSQKLEPAADQIKKSQKTKAPAVSNLRTAPNLGSPTAAEQEKLQQRIAAADAASKLGPQGNLPRPNTPAAAQSNVSAVGENRRMYGGKYVRESSDTKLLRKFQQHLLDWEHK